jgi:hypothetical protein
MTVTSTQRSVTYTGNDSTTEFPIEFYFEAGWIVATFSTVNDSGEVLSEEVVDSGEYTLSGAGEESGGSLTYPLSGEPLSASERLSIERVVPVTQERVFSNTKPYDATQHGAALDKLTMVSQEHGDDLGRCVKVPVGEETNPADLLLALRQDAAAASAAHDGAVAAREAAEAAAGKIPDIEAGDANAFLTVAADESGNEYAGGAEARAKLGLGEAALEDVVPVAKGGTGASDAAEARANLGLGDAAVEDALTAHQYVYVEQTGDDATGDGSSGNPFKTVNRALEHIGSQLMTPHSYMTIKVVGYLTDHPTIAYERLNENIAMIRGEAPAGRFTANLQYIQGAQPDWTIGFIEVTAGLAAACSVGQYVLIDEVNDSTYGENVKVTGCWKVTEVGSNYIRCAVKDRTTTTGFSNTSSCRITPLPSGIIFAPGVHGVIAAYTGVGVGMLGDIALVAGDGDDPSASSKYGIYLKPGSTAWTYGYGVGVTGWHTGVLNECGTLDANGDDLYASNCQTGLYNDGGTCRATGVKITGCSSRGYRAQHGGVNEIHGSTKVIAGNGCGVYAYYGTKILAMNGTIDYNDDSFQPNANTEGNSDSLITA